MTNTADASIHADDRTLIASDGYPLAATCFEPVGGDARGRRTVVVVMAAAGVRRRHYRRFAAFLAERGIIAVTFDYRGIGDSTSGPAATKQMTMIDWGTRDAAGVIAW